VPLRDATGWLAKPPLREGLPHRYCAHYYAAKHSLPPAALSSGGALKVNFASSRRLLNFYLGSG
jgi:hypothetical protein